MAEGEQKHLTAAGEGVESYNCAVALLHSKIFFWFNALVFLVIILVRLYPPHTDAPMPHGPWKAPRPLCASLYQSV